MKAIKVRDSAAIDEFQHTLRANLGANLQLIRVFGSVARGTAAEESDIDILILVKEKTFEIKQKIYELAFEVNLKYDVVLSPKIMTQEDYGNSLFQEILFFKNLQEEGVSI